MTDKYDELVIANEKLTREIERLKSRAESQENVTKAILETMKRGEELFELRSSRVLLDIFKGLTHNLEHSIEHAQEQLRLETQGFDIKVVDGVETKEGAHSIIVRKTETGYDFSAVVDPDNVQNENTEAFVQYFESNPQVFAGRDEIVVNITMLVRPPVEKEEK